MSASASASTVTPMPTTGTCGTRAAGEATGPWPPRFSGSAGSRTCTRAAVHRRPAQRPDPDIPGTRRLRTAEDRFPAAARDMAEPAARADLVGCTPYADWLTEIFDYWYPKPQTGIRLFEEIMHLCSAGRAVPRSWGSCLPNGGHQTDGPSSRKRSRPPTPRGRDCAARGPEPRTPPSSCRGSPPARSGSGRWPRSAAPVRSARCAGAACMPRYDEDTGFLNPSVYCPDLFALIRHVRGRMLEDLNAPGQERSLMPPQSDTPAKARWHHSLTAEQFAALARGGGGQDAIGQLIAAQRSKHLILLGKVAELARRGDHPDDALGVAGYQLLAQVQRRDPTAAAAVIGYPSVGAWALHVIRSSAAPTENAAPDDTASVASAGLPGVRPSGLAAIAAAAAIRAGLDAEIEVPVLGAGVLLPSLGTAEAVGATAVVAAKEAEVRSGSLRVRVRPGEPGWRELRRATACPLSVLIDDLDPFRMPTSDGGAAGSRPRRSQSSVPRCGPAGRCFPRAAQRRSRR